MLRELGLYKEKLQQYFKESEDICCLLLGDDYKNIEDFDDAFDDACIDSLFVPEIVTKCKSYICYDVIPVGFGSSVKSLNIKIFAVVHKDYLRNYSNLSCDIRTKYHGNRADKLAQAIEESLFNSVDEEGKRKSDTFGIGNLEEMSGTYYNSEKFYGRVMEFKVPNFR